MVEKPMKIVMYPWLAMGHIISYFQLGNKLAERGHQVTLLLPSNAKLKLQSSNHHPLFNFQTISIPHVDPLPLGTQLNSDIPSQLETHLATAFDLTRPEFESILTTLQPNLIFFDFAHWVPEVVGPANSTVIGLFEAAKCVVYHPVCSVAVSYAMIPFRDPPKDRPVTEEDTCVAPIPPGYPSSTIILKPKDLLFIYMPYGEGFTFYQRITTGIKGSHGIVFRTSREIEGKYCDYLSSQYNKPVLLTGPILPDADTKEGNLVLQSPWSKWLDKFCPNSVVFCSLGSQTILKVDQFQEMLLGFEMTRLPFMVIIKPPAGYRTVEEAFPDGFVERVGDQGVVIGEWIKEPLTVIINHPSIGCFVHHCGFGSMWDSLLSTKQIVLVPQLNDQVMYSKLMCEELKVAVQVERGQDGSWVSKQSFSKAILSVMDEANQVGDLVRTNHEYWRQRILNNELMSNIDKFAKDLQLLFD